MCRLVFKTRFSMEDNAQKFKKLHTILNIKKGDLKEVGTTHFASVSILEEIFKGWKLIHFEEKIKKIRYPNNNEQRAIFSFVLKKMKNFLNRIRRIKFDFSIPNKVDIFLVDEDYAKLKFKKDIKINKKEKNKLNIFVLFLSFFELLFFKKKS